MKRLAMLTMATALIAAGVAEKLLKFQQSSNAGDWAHTTNNATPLLEQMTNGFN